VFSSLISLAFLAIGKIGLAVQDNILPYFDSIIANVKEALALKR